MSFDFEYEEMLIDHPQSGVVYNFGRVCLSVCICVCQTITFENLDIGSSFLSIRYILSELWVTFVYEGHRVKAKVMKANMVQNVYSRNVKL